MKEVFCQAVVAGFLAADRKEKVCVLSLFSHNMTVDVRFVLTEPEIDREQLWAMNEIQHQITNSLIVLSSREDEWDMELFADVIAEHASASGIEEHVRLAITQTLNAI